jgi:hypothetical protein
MHPRLALLAAAAALALAGCGSSESSSANAFEGPEREVAQVVEDLQRAGQTGDAERVCGELLTAELAERLAEGGESCVDELDKAFGDSEDFELQVTGATVSGNTATAQVRQGGEGRTTATFELVRERGRWRISSLERG